MSGWKATSCGEPQAEERILVVCTRYIGDTVLAIPFLRNLRRAFPNATIDICAEGAAREVLSDCPYVDRFATWKRPAGRRSLAASLASIRSQAAWLARRRYSRVYLLKRSLSAGLLAALAGIPKRIGLKGDGSFFHTRSVAVPRGRHQADRYLDLLRTEGITVDDGHAENWTAADARQRVAGLLARLPVDRPRVFVAVRSTDAKKHWPTQRWAAIVEWLVERRGTEVILCGGRGDIPAHEALRTEVGHDVAAHVHDFTRDLSLREAGALTAEMDACVGVDTGLVHTAASHGVPVAVLFGPTNPNQWSPWTARAVVVRSSHVRQSLADKLAAWRSSRPTAWPFGQASMDDIGVEDVAIAIASLLPEHTTARTPAITPEPVAAPAAAAAPAAVQAPTPLRTLDLREGSFRYEVVARDAAAALPATKPLAQAH
jgi:heptosyltransferase-2